MRRELRTPDDVVKEIRKVTADDVQKLAKKIFVDKYLNLAVVGPVEDEKKLKQALKF
jgi:predicted Zn-dependent peptidase